MQAKISFFVNHMFHGLPLFSLKINNSIVAEGWNYVSVTKLFVLETILLGHDFRGIQALGIRASGLFWTMCVSIMLKNRLFGGKKRIRRSNFAALFCFRV